MEVRLSKIALEKHNQMMSLQEKNQLLQKQHSYMMEEVKKLYGLCEGSSQLLESSQQNVKELISNTEKAESQQQLLQLQVDNAKCKRNEICLKISQLKLAEKEIKSRLESKVQHIRLSHKKVTQLASTVNQRELKNRNCENSIADEEIKIKEIKRKIADVEKEIRGVERDIQTQIDDVHNSKF